MDRQDASPPSTAQRACGVLIPESRDRAAVAGEFEAAPGIAGADEPLTGGAAPRVVSSIENTAEILTDKWQRSPLDRRCAPRVRLKREVRLRRTGAAGRPDAQEAWMRGDAELCDLSHGGMFLQTARRMEPGALIVGAFRPDPLNLGHPIRFAAQVVWCARGGPRRGVGLRFTELTPDGLQTVARLVETARAR